MRDFIVEQMNKGVSLEDLHITVERMFNEEYKKREAEKLELKKREAAGIALKRAAQATADYFNLMLDREEYTAKEFEFMLHDLAGMVIDADRMGMKAVANATERARARVRAQETPIFQTTKAEDMDMEAIQEFLKSISGK